MTTYLNWQNRSVYLELMRVDRPIGTYLVLWPALWSLMLASGGKPSLLLVAVFCAGSFLMRSAGCVINDYADRHWDGKVERTKNRPFAEDRVQESEALQLFVVLCLSAALLLLFTNKLTWLWSLGAVCVAAIYPFTKRITYLPQFVLGMAFAWPIPMAFAAQSNEVPGIAWLLYSGVLAWVVAYDTFYAMVDRDDDIRAGIKSTAILFGRYDKLITALLQILFILSIIYVGVFYESGLPFYLGIAVAICLSIYQQYIIRNRERDACFKAFLNNHYVGMSIFLGLLGDTLIR